MANEHTSAVDLGAVRVAVYRRDAAAFLAAVRGRRLDGVLQQVGVGFGLAFAERRDEAAPLAFEVVDLLLERGAPGDSELADDLRAWIRGDQPDGKVLPVALDEVQSALESDFGDGPGGCYVDLTTGDVYPEFMTDEYIAGEGNEIDPEAEPDRWVYLSRPYWPDGWNDMAAFVDDLPESGVRDRLDRAIRGKGAFRRFRDAIEDAGMREQWLTFKDERAYGRARQRLAEVGIRVG